MSTESNPFDSWEYPQLLDHYEMFRDFPRMRMTHADEFAQVEAAIGRKFSAMKRVRESQAQPDQT